MEPNSVPPITHLDYHQVKLELHGAVQRMQQMEKSMLWWSQCTENWRLKWSRERSERDVAREELRRVREERDQANTRVSQLTAKLDTCEQELRRLGPGQSEAGDVRATDSLVASSVEGGERVESFLEQLLEIEAIKAPELELSGDEVEALQRLVDETRRDNKDLREQVSTLKAMNDELKIEISAFRCGRMQSERGEESEGETGSTHRRFGKMSLEAGER